MRTAMIVLAAVGLLVCAGRGLAGDEGTGLNYFNFNDFLGRQTEDSVGYAVCYGHAPAERKGVRLKVVAADQAAVYLNGTEVVKHDQARALEKDRNAAAVTPPKGVNVLGFKVVNEKVDWSDCACFTDKGDNGLKVTAAPKERAGAGGTAGPARRGRYGGCRSGPGRSCGRRRRRRSCTCPGRWPEWCGRRSRSWSSSSSCKPLGGPWV
jgi:hypothetical protein